MAETNGNKVWLTAKVRSTRLNRDLVTYDNVNPAGTFQTGTIGEFNEEYFPVENESTDCPYDPGDGGGIPTGTAFSIQSLGGPASVEWIYPNGSPGSTTFTGPITICTDGGYNVTSGSVQQDGTSTCEG